MTYEEAIDGLKYLISDDCTDSQFDYIDEIEIAIKFLEAWDEVLDELEHKVEEYEYYGDAGGAMGLYIAAKIIKQKLKEVEE